MTAAGKDNRTYAELCKAAVELEREFKWSAAADLYALASKKAKHPPARQAAITKKEAALKNAAADVEALVDAIRERVDTLAGRRTGAVEAAMPTIGVEPAMTLTVAGGPAFSLDQQLAGNPTAEANAASWDAAQPTAEELAAPDEDTDAEEFDALLEERGVISPGPMPFEEDARAAVEAVLDAPKIPKTKTTNKEKTMATTETAKLSDREAMLAKKERVRMKQNKIEIGTELQHIRRGKTLARCTYAAERQFVYKGKVYSSLSDAGSAAAKDIGLKNPSVNGWIFWGVEKREA